MRNWFGMVLLLTAVQAWAGTPALFELRDGSRIRGEIVSMEGGNYTVRSGTLGTVTLTADQLASINMQPDAPATAGGMSGMDAGALASRMQSVQGLIANDPAMMAAIQSLQGDAQFQAVLSDPQLMQAVQSGNINALLENPKFRALMEHGAVQDIGRRLNR